MKVRIVKEVKRSDGLQRAKNPVSASALLTVKFLRVRKVFARLICNGNLKAHICLHSANHAKATWMISSCLPLNSSITVLIV